MRLGPDQLAQHLRSKLLPVYLIAGDEPLQMRDSADLVRARARADGFAAREVFEVDKGFDWARLRAASDNLSLFAEKRLLDVRLASVALGRDGSQAMADYLSDMPPDTAMLVTSPKLERRNQRARWIEVLEAAGVIVQVWPVEAQRLQNWLQQRMMNYGLVIEQDALNMLAYCSEGNLLAADQAIQKILLLNDGDASVDSGTVERVVSDSARFDVYALAENALIGRSSRALRMLSSLRSEGTAAAVILWAVARELRIVNALSEAVSAGQSLDPVFRQWNIWDRRRPLYQQALPRFPLSRWRRFLQFCARVDAAVKGQSEQDDWFMLERLVYALGGVEPATLC